MTVRCRRWAEAAVAPGLDAGGDDGAIAGLRCAAALSSFLRCPTETPDLLQIRFGELRQQLVVDVVGPQQWRELVQAHQGQPTLQLVHGYLLCRSERSQPTIEQTVPERWRTLEGAVSSFTRAQVTPKSPAARSAAPASRFRPSRHRRLQDLARPDHFWLRDPFRFLIGTLALARRFRSGFSAAAWIHRAQYSSAALRAARAVVR